MWRGRLARERLEAREGQRFELAFFSIVIPSGARDLQFACGFLDFQFRQLASHFSSCDRQSPHAHRQIEAPRARAARIEIEHTVLLFDLRPMAVTVHDYAESRAFRLQIELPQIMQHIDRNVAGFNDLSFGQRARPGVGVDVAADGSYRRDLRECFEDFGCADVAGVEDAVGTAQGFDGFGTQEAVGVGD